MKSIVDITTFVLAILAFIATKFFKIPSIVIVFVGGYFCTTNLDKMFFISYDSLMEGPKTPLHKIQLTPIDPYVEQTPGSPIEIDFTLPTQAPDKQLTPAPIPGRPDITLPTYKDGQRNNTLDQYRGIDTAGPEDLATVPMPSSRNTQNE